MGVPHADPTESSGSVVIFKTLPVHGETTDPRAALTSNREDLLLLCLNQAGAHYLPIRAYSLTASVPLFETFFR